MKTNTPRHGLTPRIALERSIVLWQYLAEHPNENKFFAMRNCFPAESPLYDCFCCEYARVPGPCATCSDTVDCTLCPAWDVPPEADQLEPCGCEAEDSDYLAWVRGTREERAIYAARLVEFFQSCLNNLPKES